MPRIHYATLENCSKSTDIVISVDVIRAFTTAAYAFAAGASEIYLVSTVDQAFKLREKFPDALTLGEVHGKKPEGFDFCNSPKAISQVNLTGKRLIQRTSSGTQGVVLCHNAAGLMAASFVCATATARYIRMQDAQSITFVITGSDGKSGGIEDEACADFIAELVCGNSVEAAPYLAQAAKWRQYLECIPEDLRPILEQDQDLCLQADVFQFAMPVERQNGFLVMRPYYFKEEK